MTVNNAERQVPSPRVGVMLSEFVSPSMAIITRAAGYEFVVVDAEHGPFPLEAAAGLCAVGITGEQRVLIRVADQGREGITKALDMGAAGVVVPMVSSVDEARQVVAHSRYGPIGARGVSTTRLHSKYNPGPLKEFMAEANQRLEVWTQIETVRGLEEAESIGSVPGLSGLILGPNDLLQDLGRPGEYTCSDIEAAIFRVGEAAHGHKLSAGIITANEILLRHALNAGFDFVCQGSEIGLLIKAGNAARSAVLGWMESLS